MLPSFRPAALALLLIACASRVEGQSRTVADDRLVHVVDSVAAVAISRGITPAIGVAVARRGKLLLARGYGMADASRGVPADDGTLWYLASTSKSFTGFAVSLMAERGELRFDSPVRALLPRARWHPDARPDSLTLARFLSHTHHLQTAPVVVNAAFSGAMPESRWPELLQHAAPTGSSDLSYNNLSYNVAAMVIDALHPEGWRAWMQANVFGPAGMRDTYARVSGLPPARIALPHELTPDGTWRSLRFEKADVTMNSAGGHLATMGDLARWMMVQMDSGIVDGTRVFPASAVARSHALLAAHTVERARSFAFFRREGWGAGWDIGSYEGERMVSRFGSYHTTRSHLSFLPGRRIGVAALTTAREGSIVTDILAALAYDLDAGRDDALEQAARRMETAQWALAASRSRAVREDSLRAVRRSRQVTAPESYVGVYRHDFLGAFEVTRTREGLGWRWGVLHGELLVDDPPSRRFVLSFAGNDFPLTFTSAAGGQARSLTFNDATFLRAAR